jgi:hypothetical protein
MASRTRRVAVLGNCIAERLQAMLAAHNAFDGASLELVPLPAVHVLSHERLEGIAAALRTCDVIFSQPLFSYGPCNTDRLRTSLAPSQRLVLFASPHFAAYFPDAIELAGKRDLRFPPILDWDSSIILSCFFAGVSVFDVEAIYLNHPLFSRSSVAGALERSFREYAKRETAIDLPTAAHLLRRCRAERLFHTPRHPVDDFLGHMCSQMLATLDIEATALPVDGFGFNRWPVVTRRHGIFSFPEQRHFIVAGRRSSIEDTAMAYYNFYEFHPHVVEANRHMAVPLP